MVKRGLIVSYYFPPTGGGGVQRWVKLIKYLQPMGWEFTVISNAYNAESPRDDSLLNDIPASTNIIRISTPDSNFKSKIPFFRKSGYWQRWISAFINVTDSRESWNYKVKDYICREIKKNNYNVVILSAPPYSLSLLAADLTQIMDIPVVLDLRDPWTINPYKIHPTCFHRYLDKKREEKSIAAINFVMAAYESTLTDFESRIPGFKEKKELLLPNGYDEDDFSNLKAVNIPMEYDLNIGFSGSFYSHLNTPHQVFAAIRLLKEENINICFHHIGSSVQDLERLARKYKISANIKVWGYKKHKDCLALLNMTDVLCMILDSKWQNSRYTVGGKFYEYLRLKKPILAIVPDDGEAASAIKETDSGLVVSQNRAPMIASALKQLLQSNMLFSWKGIRKYDRAEQAKKLNKFLGEL